MWLKATAGRPALVHGSEMLLGISEGRKREMVCETGFIPFFFPYAETQLQREHCLFSEHVFPFRYYSLEMPSQTHPKLLLMLNRIKLTPLPKKITVTARS